MPLQIRRGTEAERQTLASPLVSGELLWITDDEKLYIGNGTTLAKDLTPVTGFGNQEAKDAAASIFTAGTHSGISFSYNGSTAIDATVSIPALLQNLNTNGFDISGNGNITISGTVTANAFIGDYKGSIFADDSTILVDAIDGSINLDGTVKSDIIPSIDNFYDLGSNSNRFKDLYIRGTVTANAFIGDYKGSIFADDSTILVDAIDGSINLDGTVKSDIIPDLNEIYDIGSSFNRFKDLYLSGSSIYLGDAVIASTGTIVNLPAGSTVDGVEIGTAIGQGVIDGSNYLINIIADDSTVLVNGFTKEFNGTLNGDVVTNLISSSDSSTIVCDTPFEFQTNVVIDGTLEIGDGAVLRTNDPGNLIDMVGFFDSNLPVALRLRKSRGSSLSPAALQTDDRIGSVLFNAFDGNDYINAASIQARISGTVSSGVTPTSLRFLINDTIGDEVESLRIDESGSVRVFRALYAAAPDGFTNYTNLRLTNHHTSTSEAANFAMQRSRGTFDNPSTVFDGDPMYDISFRGYDGSNYVNSANIRGVVDGTVSTGVVPGRLDFVIRGSSGAITVTSQFSAVKAVFNTMLQLPTFADDTAADAAIGGAGNRVNGMMFYNTALGAIRAVVGGSWASL